MSGHPFVVADRLPVPGSPGQRPLDYPPAGQHFEGVQFIAAFDDLKGELERGLGLGDELAFAAASRPWTLAAVISAVRSSPMVPTAMCLLRPLTFLP